MDLDIQDETDDDLSGSHEPTEADETNSDSSEKTSNGQNEGDDATALARLQDLLRQNKSHTLSEKRWERLREFYVDDYLETFKESQESQEYISEPDFEATQLGAVTWLPREKYRLYETLSRKGRLDIPTLARAVGTKSQLEVTDYLHSLQSQQRDRHLFARHVDRLGILSYAELPAAVEVSGKCEAALERAADALEALQDRYDNLARRQDGSADHSTLRIDGELAEAIDQVTETMDIDEDSTGNADVDSIMETADFFNVCNFTTLSELLFMNAGGDHIDRNWSQFAIEHESPAVTFAVVREFHELAVNLTRKIMQSAIFLAKSRLRAVRVEGNAPKHAVKVSDIHAALDILNLKRDSFQFWIGAARRSQVQVVRDSHQKGASRIEVLPYEVVESALTARRRQDHFRRSRSVTTEPSSEIDDSVSEMSIQPVQGSTESDHKRSSGDVRSSVVSSESSSANEEGERTSNFSSSEELSSPSSSDDSESYVFHATTPARKLKQIRLERQQDKYLKELDKIASEREERRLWESLGRDPQPTVKMEEDDKPATARPMVLRKAPDELQDWTDAVHYRAEWEVFGTSVGEECFVETDRVRKKRKADELSE